LFVYQLAGLRQPIFIKFSEKVAKHVYKDVYTRTTEQRCGLRPSVLGQDQKIGLDLALAGPVLCCEILSCYARHHNDLEGHSNFSSTIYYSFSVLCLEHHCTYLNVKSAKCLCLLPVNLVFFTSLPPKKLEFCGNPDHVTLGLE